MKDPNENRPGYKHTKVGWIPEEWEESRLEKHATISHGWAFKSEFFSRSGSLVVLTPGNFNEKGGFRLRPGLDRCYTGEFPAQYLLKEGQMLVAMTEQAAGLLGSAAIIPEEGKYLHNQRLGLVSVSRSHELDLGFLFNLLNASRARRYIAVTAAGTKVRHTSPERILSLSVPLPPLPEQQKIAEILSTWDEAIEQTRKLIDAKKRRKKGFMQQLLTSKRRLPGFQGEWEWPRASEVFARISRRSRGNEPVLSATQDSGIVARESIEKRIEYNRENLGNYKLIEAGDFVISLRSFQGGLELSGISGRVSPAYHVIRGNSEVTPDFYRYYFKSSDFIGRLAIAVIGIRDGKQVSYDDFSFMRIPLPRVAEQKAIAAVLQTADEDITHLEAQLMALEKQKRGLMQKLLTGAVRVRI